MADDKLMTSLVRVGSFDVEVSSDHIYLYPNLPYTYDYVPWNIIGHIIESGGLEDCALIDVGANVGDTLAHFRRISSGPVLCIEAADVFFEILQRNSAQFEDVTLLKQLLVPDDLVGKVGFVLGHGTGSTSKTVSNGDVWRGDYTTFSDLFKSGSKRYIIKSDTDGFDADIIRSAISHIKNRVVDVPALFFEGPNEDQMKSGNYEDFINVCNELVDLDYEILFLTNVGWPYMFCGNNKESIRAVFTSLLIGYQRGFALCHYYDIIAVRREFTTEFFKLERAWDDRFFARD